MKCQRKAYQLIQMLTSKYSQHSLAINTYQILDFFVVDEKVLVKDQIKLAKAPKRKVTRAKARNIVEHLQEVISNKREDFVQKVSLNLVKTSALMTFKDLNVKGMTKNDRFMWNIADAS